MTKIDIYKTMMVGDYRRLKSIRAVARLHRTTSGRIRNVLFVAGLGDFFKPNKGRRDYLSKDESARYTQWTKSVLTRDDYKCQIDGSTDKITAHHIRVWSKNKDLRYDVDNGITLCRKCHLKTYKREEEWEERLSSLVVNRGFKLPFEVKVYEGRPKERACTSCGKMILLKDFPKHIRCKWGIRSVCRDCDRKISAERYHKHTGRCRAAADKWQREHRKERREYQQRWLFKKEIKELGFAFWTQKRAALGLVCRNPDDYRPCAL